MITEPDEFSKAFNRPDIWDKKMMTPPDNADVIKKGRIFNHRDGMSELRRFEMEQNADAVAEKIMRLVSSLMNWTPFSRADKTNYAACIQEIAGALREYGEECVERERSSHCMDVMVPLEHFDELMELTDADCLIEAVAKIRSLIKKGKK